MPGGGGGGNTVTVTNPGSQTSTAGTAASLQIAASDSASGQTLTYSATGLPAGLSISSSSGLISGTPTTAGTSSVTVTVRDTTGASGPVSFGWTVNAQWRLVRPGQPRPERSDDCLVGAEHVVPGRRRHRREHRYPLVQRVLRSAVARGRPGLGPADLPGDAGLGGGLRDRFPDPGRPTTARPGRTIYSTTTGTGGTQTLNVSGTGRYIRMYGTARATQYGYSLWEFSGVRHRLRRQRLRRRPTSRSNQPDHGVLRSRTPRSRRRTPLTATPAPAGPARSPIRSGSRSISARPSRSARWCWLGTACACFQIRPSNDGSTWTHDLLHDDQRGGAWAAQRDRQPLHPDVRHPCAATLRTHSGSSSVAVAIWPSLRRYRMGSRRRRSQIASAEPTPPRRKS